MNRHFDSFGGGVHHTAVIGQMPEDGRYRPGVVTHEPTIARTARLEAFVTVDAGLEGDTLIDSDVWLLKRVHVGHNAEILSGSVVATGTVVGGYARIGRDVRIGINATILPFRKIGDGAEIGAGAVVTKDVPAGEVWAGNPARCIGPKNPIPHSERKSAWMSDEEAQALVDRIKGKPRILSEQEAGDYIRAHG